MFNVHAVKKEIIKVDVEHNGTLDFDEFFDLMTSLMTGWNPEQDLGKVHWKLNKRRSTVY